MDRVELPNGDVVEPGEVILFEGYPYRVQPNDEFVLSPVYWGDSELDLVFDGPGALEDRWGEESRGRLSEPEWEAWLAGARRDDRFGEAELDEIADAVLGSPGLLDRVRRLFGLE